MVTNVLDMLALNRAFNIVKELWEDGSISEEQIDISVKKILSLKSERLNYIID